MVLVCVCLCVMLQELFDPNPGSRLLAEDPTTVPLPHTHRAPSLVVQKNVPECPSPRTGRQQDLGQTKKQTKKIIVGQDEKVSPY